MEQEVISVHLGNLAILNVLVTIDKTQKYFQNVVIYGKRNSKVYLATSVQITQCACAH